MQVHVAAPAMVRRKVKDDLDVADRLLRHAGPEQVGVAEVDAAGLEVRLQVFAFAARKIVNHPHPRAAIDQCVHQVRADKGSPSGHQHAFAVPVHHRSLLQSYLRRPFSSR